MAYVSITVEGGLFPSDLLDRIATGDAVGQREGDFGVSGRLSDEIQDAFSDMRSFWDAFQRRLAYANGRHTTITRESWLIPLLERLGYQDHGNEIVLWRPAPQIDGVTYAISHRAGEDPDAPPLHIVSIDQLIDRRADRERRSPHGTVQEFLNRSPALWGIVTNGKVLRLLRDTQLVARPTYLEFDLRAMVEGNLYSEFVLFYRLLQRSRLPKNDGNPNDCLLETYYQEGLEEGGRVRDHLREGVEAALETLGTALLRHPRSEALRAALRDSKLDAAGYYRELLRLVYRLLFLMVVEERKLLDPPDTTIGRPSALSAAGPHQEGRPYQAGHTRDLTPGTDKGGQPSGVSRPLRRRLGDLQARPPLPDRPREDLVPGTGMGGEAAANGADGLQLRLIYQEYYSIARLRDRAERRFSGDRYTDLWEGLSQTFRLFREDEEAQKVGLAALNGELFGGDACRHIEGAVCENVDLLTAIFRLSTFLDGKVRRRVNYAGLDVEELGSVYESLLDYQPRIEVSEADARTPTYTFALVAGGERKQTGSYYTPPSLVRELIESALVPVIEDRLRRAGADLIADDVARGSVPVAPADLIAAKEVALLDLRVCDPAAGSGHFLLAAGRRIARELAKVRSGELEPAPEEYRAALRDVVRNCLYAVDKNELAVDLCKVALWIEGYNAGYPLSFLDNHIKQGDALVGVWDLEVLRQGIPDGAYAPVTGDDKKAAGQWKKLNREQRDKAVRTAGEGWDKQHQTSLLGAELPGVADFAERHRQLGLHEERTPYEVHQKEKAYNALRGQDTDWWTTKVACDLWTGAFFLPLVAGSSYEDTVPTTGTIRRYLQQPKVMPACLPAAVELSETHPFFHWPLEFPDVWDRGGFDVVLGNPPWERIKLQEEEFFAGRDPEIAKAPNKAARQVLIKNLPEHNPALAASFGAAKHRAEAESKFVRGSGRFPLCGRGDVNTYSIFAELNRGAINGAGRVGCIVPSGIATDDTTKLFFQSLMDERSVASLYDFENKGIFSSVDDRYKFCLLTLTGTERPAEHGSEFAFFLHDTAELREARRRFILTRGDMRLFNPNTRTCPIFRTRRDAELTKAIYRRVPVLIEEGPPEENPWGIHFLRMFDMANDSHLFRTRPQLEAAGWRLEGNIFVDPRSTADATPPPAYLPLYEAKMIHQFDHRWASYAGIKIRDMTDAEKEDSLCLPLPRYWVPATEVEARLKGRWDRGWLLGWRDICRSTDERTVIASAVPRVGVGHTLPLMTPKCLTAPGACNMSACLSAFVLDYAARQKIGGTHLTYGYLNQLPVLPPSTYDQPTPWSPTELLQAWIAPRVLALTYTAWDIRPFALDLGYKGPPFPWDEEKRFALCCELDAAFFHLYGISREDVAYIMDTFPIVKRKDVAAHGEYRTKRVTLEIYDSMAQATETGVPYVGSLPQPEPPLVADVGAG